MNASPLLVSVVNALAAVRLEAVLIGNAAAALHGAPVTTLDFDFMFRKTPLNITKLKKFANQVNGVVLRPFYPVSLLYRVVNEDTGLQVDFMPVIHGVKSFNSLRSRSERVSISGRHLWVASLEDIIASKRAAGRPRDHAVIEVLNETQRQKANRTK